MKKKVMATFLQRVGYLLQKGYSLNDAIQLFSALEKAHIKKDTTFILTWLKQGEPLYVVLKKLQFPKIVIAMLYFSERHGNLQFSLIEGGKVLKAHEKSKAQLVEQLRYPLFLLVFLLLLFIIIAKQLIPQFESVFQSLNYNLPTHTQIVLNTIAVLPQIILFCTLSLLLICVAIHFLMQHVHQAFHVVVKVPWIGGYLKLYATQFFSLHLSCLLQSGLSLYEALQVFSNQMYVKFLHNEAQTIQERLKNGERMEEILADSAIFNFELSRVFIHGQASGKLPEDLFHYSEVLQENLQKNLTAIFQMLQPVTFIFIGIVVCIMFLTVLLPIFQLIQAI
jgi:competence protein ComGB